jgi:predicted dehydrogenase
VGCGQWGRNVLRDLLALGCRCVVADPSAQARDHALGAGAALVVDAPEQLPPALDGYVVVTPASTHHAVVTALSGRQRPVFVEKPLTAHAATAIELVRLMPDRLFVMEKWRYHGGIQHMADLLRAGDLGRPLGLHCRRVQWGQSQDDVNPIWTLLPHDLSIAHHVLGALPTPVTAQAEFDPATGLPLALNAQLRVGQVAVSIEVSSRARLKERRVVLRTDRGTLTLADPLADHLLWTPAAPPPGHTTQALGIDTEAPLRRELQAFLAHLRGGPPPLACAQGAADSVALIESLLALAGAPAPGQT